MAFIPSIVAVSFYFEKRRSIAIGIAVCGTGIGTFAVAPLTNALLSEYSWKGTTLIEAGILLNCIMCGMIFRPLNVGNETHEDKERVNEKASTKVAGVEESRMRVRSASAVELRHSSHVVERSLEKSTLGKEEKPTVVVEFAQPGMTVSTAANAELLQTWATSSPTVTRRRRHSEPAWSLTSPTQLAGTTAAHGNVVHTRSLSPQHRAERDDCVRSTTSPNEQREPRSDKSWLAKIYKTEEKEGKRTELIGADLPRTKTERANTADCGLVTPG